MTGALSLPSLPAALRVWRRNLRVFSKIWRGALLPLFFDPLFYLVAMGFGLGTYIAHINGVPYREFIAPGLCASAVMWAASFEMAWNAFFKMEETRLYDSILATPIEVEDLVTGELLWAGTRAVIYGTTFLIVISAFGLVESGWAAAMPPFLLLGGLCFATIGLAYTSLIPKMDYFTFFFPYDKLPEWAQVVAWFTPLYHLVLVCRELATGPDAAAVAGNAAWLAVLTALLFSVPVVALRRRLVA